MQALSFFPCFLFTGTLFAFLSSRADLTTFATIRSADLFTRSCIQLTGSIHSLLPQFLSLRVTLILCSVLGSSQSSHPPHLISQIVLKDVLCKQISIYILNICKSDETCTFCFIFR